MLMIEEIEVKLNRVLENLISIYQASAQSLCRDWVSIKGGVCGNR